MLSTVARMLIGACGVAQIHAAQLCHDDELRHILQKSNGDLEASGDLHLGGNGSRRSWLGGNGSRRSWLGDGGGRRRWLGGNSRGSRNLVLQAVVGLSAQQPKGLNRKAIREHGQRKQGERAHEDHEARWRPMQSRAPPPSAKAGSWKSLSMSNVLRPHERSKTITFVITRGQRDNAFVIWPLQRAVATSAAASTAPSPALAPPLAASSSPSPPPPPSPPSPPAPAAVALDADRRLHHFCRLIKRTLFTSLKIGFPAFLSRS